jgi:hypothetical protein
MLRGFRSAIYSMLWVALLLSCGMAVRRMGKSGVSVRYIMAQTVKMGRVAKIGKDRI